MSKQPVMLIDGFPYETGRGTLTEAVTPQPDGTVLRVLAVTLVMDDPVTNDQLLQLCSGRPVAMVLPDGQTGSFVIAPVDLPTARHGGVTLAVSCTEVFS